MRGLLLGRWAGTLGFALVLAMPPGSAVATDAPGETGCLAGGISLRGYDQAELVTFPWGWIRWLMNGKTDPQAEMTVGIVQLEPDQSNPYHQHPNSAEYVHVLSGSCEQLAGEKWVPMKAGDIMRFPKGVPHMARTGREACRMMVIYDTGNRQMVPVKPLPGQAAQR